MIKTPYPEDQTINFQAGDIASDLHASREAISRLLKVLEKDGRVKLSRNKIELL